MQSTLPKSDSNTSLSSLISIGNESKNSGSSTERCIICLGDELPILSTIEDKSCKCVYHYHENCLKEWFEKHSSLCPICRKQSRSHNNTIEVYTFTFTLWQKFIFSIGCLTLTLILVWSIVKNGLN
jgi:hypothetical protein